MLPRVGLVPLILNVGVLRTAAATLVAQGVLEFERAALERFRLLLDQVLLVVGLVRVLFVFVGQSVVDFVVVVAQEFDVARALEFLHLLVVVGDVVLPGGGLAACELRNEVPEFVVDGLTLLPGVQIHIAEGVDRFRVRFGVGGVAPVGLDARDVPLVYDGDDLLARGVAVDAVEEVQVLFVDHNALLEGRHALEKLDEPVRARAVHGLGEGFAAQGVQGVVDVAVLGLPVAVVQGAARV